MKKKVLTLLLLICSFLISHETSFAMIVNHKSSRPGHPLDPLNAAFRVVGGAFGALLLNNHKILDIDIGFETLSEEESSIDHVGLIELDNMDDVSHLETLPNDIMIIICYMIGPGSRITMRSVSHCFRSFLEKYEKKLGWIDTLQVNTFKKSKSLSQAAAFDELLHVPTKCNEKVLVIDPAQDNKIVHILSVGREPLAPVAIGYYIYISNRGSGTVSVFDLSYAFVQNIEVGYEPNEPVAIGSLIYVTDKFSVSAIDPFQGHQVTHRIPVGRYPRQPLVFGTSLIVACNNGVICVIDTANGNLVHHIQVGLPRLIRPVLVDLFLYAASSHGTIYKIDTQNNYAMLQTIKVGKETKEPLEVGQCLYVPCRKNVHVVDVVTDKVIQIIPVGSYPLTPVIVGSYLFVSNYNSGTLSVIDTAHGNKVVQTIHVGSHPKQPVRIGTSLYITTSGGKLHEIDIRGYL